MIARLIIDDQFGTEHLGMRSRDLSDEELAAMLNAMVLRLSDIDMAAKQRALSRDEVDDMMRLVGLLTWIQQGGDHE